MMQQRLSISEMISQSIVVLTQPSIESFEKYEKQGGMREALTYVGAAAALVGIVSFVFGIFGGFFSALAGLIMGVAVTLVGFFVFAYALHYVGKQQGGTGTQDEVFYTASLYTAPILAITGVVGAIPLLGCVLMPATLILSLYQAYLGYLATRSSMNLDQTKAIITVVLAVVISFVVATVLLGGILSAIFFGSFAVSGSLG